MLKDSMETGKNALAESNSRLEHASRELKEKRATCEAEFSQRIQWMQAKISLNESNSRIVQENGVLGEKLATSEAELRKQKCIVISISFANGNSQTGVSNVEDQLVSTNDIDTGKDNKTEQPDVDVMLAEVGKENELLKEKVSSSEAKLSEEGKEKLKLLRSSKLE
ncbi:hypothetical protein V6N13_041085 [Hibiscus sabdariffa]